ncbi:MAG: glycosyl hydrolase [Flavobacteriaceae bacterium]|nr:glycosyl hydrolase [Flavobacteriaceae bacterium]
MNKLLKFFIIIFPFTVLSQSITTSNDVLKGLDFQNKLIDKSIIKKIKFENIGPSIMSGRVSDIEVNPKNSNEFYVAYASGGLWHTTNNGNTFKSVFDNANTQNIGDFDVDWLNKILIVGTGENNSSRSSYAGIGILKSIDNGKNWINIGLTDSHHIGKVRINPQNSKEIVVGVIGHLYSKNSQRGIFKTNDGGKTWNKTLFIDNETGIIDLDIDPNNFNIQFASSWQRDRTPWNFNGNGDKSGIYKSMDGGENWTLITNEGSGFPKHEGVGRIGVSVFDEKIIYAIIDNQSRRPKEKIKSKQKGLDKMIFENLSLNEFEDLNDLDLNQFLKANGFPKKYDAKKVKELVESREILPIDLKLFLEDANTVMFETPIIGAEVYRSNDGGVNWTKKNDDYLGSLYNTYGYYFGRIHVSPSSKENIYIYGVPILKSTDGGVSYKSIDYENVHVDHHDLWINPNDPNHLINGNDGGVNLSYDGGENWFKLNQPSVGQFYAINVDNNKPYNVYGGLQDNGVWMAKNNSKESLKWHQTGQNNWKSIMGGDGMQIQIDRRDSNIIYTGSQFGVYYRIDNNTNKRFFIKPKHDLGEQKLRFNWQSPILLSPHNQDILYFGSNKLHISLNKGDQWSFSSKDLTKGIKKGNVPYGTLTAIDESIFKFGKLVVGSDDGLINLSNDGGNTWKLISNLLPQNLWVSRVVFSKHNNERIYASLNGYRYDDFNSYVYVSNDNGNTWTSLSKNLPISSVNVIKEDPNYEELLYIGTDNGSYMSFDLGINWHPFVEGLNKVAVHDIVIQREENDLLLGTHGRSIYKTDLSLIYNYLENIDKSKNGVVFKLDDLTQCLSCGSKRNSWDQYIDKKLKVTVFSKDKQSTSVVLFENDIKILDLKINLEVGFQEIELDTYYTQKALKSIFNKNKNKKLKLTESGKYYFRKGKYVLKIGDYSESFQIK